MTKLTYFRNRDIRNLNVPDVQKEMRYTQGAGILRVTMEEDKKPQLPSLDLYSLQVWFILHKFVYISTVDYSIYYLKLKLER